MPREMEYMGIHFRQRQHDEQYMYARRKDRDTYSHDERDYSQGRCKLPSGSQFCDGCRDGDMANMHIQRHGETNTQVGDDKQARREIYCVEQG